MYLEINHKKDAKPRLTVIFVVLKKEVTTFKACSKLRLLCSLAVRADNITAYYV